MGLASPDIAADSDTEIPSSMLASASFKRRPLAALRPSAVDSPVRGARGAGSEPTTSV